MEIEIERVNMPDGSSVIRYRTIIEINITVITATEWRIAKEIAFDTLPENEQKQIKEEIM